MADRLLLSADEQARADRLRFEDDRLRFIAARAGLRQRLAALVDADPAELEFAYGEHGKPQLAGVAADSGWQFNLSHSGDVAVLAALPHLAVGVDIERLRAMRDRDALVRRHFSPAENTAYFALPEAQRQAGFFAAWTAKEALVKALGQGLRFPLRSFDVAVAHQGEGGLLTLQGRPAIHVGWSLTGWSPVPGFAAAVAAQSTRCQVLRVAS